MPQQRLLAARIASSGKVWPMTIVRLGTLYDDERHLLDMPQRLAAKPSRGDQFVGSNLGGFDSTIAARATLRGPAATLSLQALVEGRLPPLIKQVGATADHDRRFGAHAIMSYVNTVRCCGGKLPQVAREIEGNWLPGLSQLKADALSKREKLTLAFCAAAAGKPELVGAFVKKALVPKRFVAGKAFGADVARFAGYLAAAVSANAAGDDVTPAWVDFVEQFPAQLEVRALEWDALLFAARTVYARIGKIPEGDVVSALNRMVGSDAPVPRRPRAPA